MMLHQATFQVEILYALMALVVLATLAGAAIQELMRWLTKRPRHSHRIRK